MHFSSGQKTFALLFLVAFIVMLALAYRSDAKIYNMYYKNVWAVLISVLLILGVIIVLIKITH